MEPSLLGSLKGLNGTSNTRVYTGSAPYGEGKSLRLVEVVLIRVSKARERIHFVPIILCLRGSGRLTSSVEDIDLRVTRQEGPGYSNGHYQKPDARLKAGGLKMGLRPGYGLKARSYNHYYGRTCSVRQE